MQDLLCVCIVQVHSTVDRLDPIHLPFLNVISSQDICMYRTHALLLLLTDREADLTAPTQRHDVLWIQ